MTRYIIVSMAKKIGSYPIDKYDCGLKEDLTFDPNLNLAKKFVTKEYAIETLMDLHQERKGKGFVGSFFIKEIICL